MKNRSIFAVIICVVMGLSCQSAKNDSRVPVAKYDSLMKVADSAMNVASELRNVLKQKLENLCDTMSPEKKIAWQKYREFEEKVNSEKAKKLDDVESQNRHEKDKLLKVKNEIYGATWESYHATEVSAFTAWEKNDHKTFVEYLALRFYNERGSYDYQRYLALQKFEQQKIPALMKCFKIVKAADSLRKTKSDEAEKIYSIEIPLLETKLETQREQIEIDSKNKLRLKKIELGLE